MTGRRSDLANRREAMGMTQEGLAEALGLTRTTVYRWEKGDTEPRPYLRPKLARLLGVSVAELLGLLTVSRPADPPGIMESDESSPEQPGGNVERREFLQGVAAVGASAAVTGTFFVRRDHSRSAVDSLRAGVDRAGRLEQGAQYTALAALLPGLIHQAQRLGDEGEGASAVEAIRLLGAARVVEAFVLIKRDQPTDAQVAATRR